MGDVVSYERDGDLAVLDMDDGKANVFGFAMFEAFNAALDRALDEAGAVVIAGRPGILSGGFDLGVIRGGDPAALEKLVSTGVRLMMRVYVHPQPVVTAATGHAVALGAFLLLASDWRVGTAGEFRIGLNESAIGLELPAFGIALARERLSPRHMSAAAIGATLYDPDGALAAGFLDEVAPAGEARARAIEQARTMTQTLDPAAFAANKRAFREDTVRGVLEALG